MENKEIMCTTFQFIFQLITNKYNFADNSHNINENVEITYNETDEKTFINFGNKSTYCYLEREKETENSFIHGNCSLPIDKVTKNLEGVWTVKMGVKGNMDEEQSQTSVSVNCMYLFLTTIIIKSKFHYK